MPSRWSPRRARVRLASRREIDLTHPGTVRLVDRLVELAWVKRRAGHGRTVRLRITASGRRVHNRLLAARDDAVDGLMRTLDPGVVQRLAEMVAPALSAATSATDTLRHLRHLCRLCQRRACTPCPVSAGLRADETDTRRTTP